MVKTWKFTKFIVVTLLIVTAVFVGKKLIDTRNINTYATETEISIAVPVNKFYYSKLQDNEKDLYVAIHNGISRLENEIVLIQDLDEEVELTSENIGDVLDFYMKDNPGVFYVSSQYTLEQSKVMHYQIVKLHLTYHYSEADIQSHIAILENKIDEVISKRITQGMTDYEKELTLHDYLLENTEYYHCADVKSIPYEKHTAYSALINNSCVCDGFSKAFSLLLDKVNIENIVVSGFVNNTTHSWNLVKLEDEWYNIDVTSNNQTMEDGLRVKTHIFFNVNDEDISSIYKKDNIDILPECVANKYNYYTYNSYIVKSTSNIKTQLKNDINQQKNMEALEIRVESDEDITQTIVNSLYSLNFNNYRTDGIQKINYFKYEKIYIFPKNK